jgi:hypothetical protein
MRWLDGRCAWFGVVALFLNAVGCAHHHAVEHGDDLPF